jgi:hypothetical protein
MSGISKEERARRAAQDSQAPAAEPPIFAVHVFTVPDDQGVNLQDVSCIPIATRYEMSSFVGWPTRIDATTTPAQMVTTEGRWSVTLDGQTITCTQML